jgi:lysophospholipase L1-like esterase
MATAPPIAQYDSVAYLALGDSYTYGFGAPQNMSYPNQLASLLKGQNYYAALPVVIAQFGWTAGDLLNGIAASNVTRKFDFVTILIGVNDQNKGTNTETYTQQINQLLGVAVAYAHGYGNRVFVISIPDWSVTPYAANLDKAQIAAGIVLFNSINQEQCKKFGANYLDISALSQLAATDPTLTSSDGLHPSAKMYGLWANQFLSKVIATFN